MSKQPQANDSPDAYILPQSPERQVALVRLRDVFNAHLSAGFEEIMQYGMITYA